MGSCISKCRPKRIKRLKPNCTEEDFSHVHDKLVISQVSVSPSPLLIHKPVSPSPSAASTASLSSFSGATGSSGLSISSSLSTSCSSSSSSLSISKDRSFSNEFLRSCAKKNPHVIGRNFIRGKVHPQFLEPSLQERSVVIPLKQAYIPERPGGSTTPMKRTRSDSPILVRQKSFRKEPDAVSSSTVYHHHPRRNLRSPSPSRRFSVEQSFGESTSRILRSPSPSRRFNGDQGLRVSLTSTAAKDIHSKSSVVSRTNLSKSSSSSSSLRKESFRSSPSANIHSKDQNNIVLKGYMDGFCRQTGKRIDENAVEAEKRGEDSAEDMVVEDFNNPLIAMDCFIFL